MVHLVIKKNNDFHNEYPYLSVSEEKSSICFKQWTKPGESIDFSISLDDFNTISNLLKVAREASGKTLNIEEVLPVQG